MSEKLSLAQLESFLDETCDSLRGNREAAEFKEYVISILYLKRLNDRFKLEREARRNKLTTKGLSQSQIEEELEKREFYRFFVPKMARWDRVKQEEEDLGSYLMKAFAEIDDINRGCLGVLRTIDFNKTTENGNKYISNADLVGLIQDFESLKLSDDNLDF
ncbi:type I restriction-modification system subunit M N-terminal domain-containing protein [Desulfosporosinus sp. Sb-LF]|uniref:type I restriction-modification system subunit M N-terminal domain-containing protein n=1 Tax=Desulfosporosinus sp. Sb-LF TaxID=2560027 RepID=UPI00107F32BE|nr:type I restriction-modification system subunit M N-terminal domain-containing protein [Desulfosporosinus sp. Sb-LF]TGE33655.1 restriction endonuclease subunit M [Desulfosporosinus sp. Sb-LF]